MLRGMLSIGYFEKEIGIKLQTNLLERIRYCHFIVPHEDKASLLKCTNKLTLRYIEEQVQYFPNTKRVIDFWIITAYELFFF